MIDTSSAYKAAITARTEKTSAGVYVGLYDQSNEVGKTGSALGEQFLLLSDPSQVVQDSWQSDGFGLLEPGRFRLNGSFFAFNPVDAHEVKGWVGSEIPASSAFSGTQGVRIVLASAVQIRYGLAISWDRLGGEYATSVRIVCKLSGSSVFDQTFESGEFGMISFSVTSADTIEIRPLAWSVPFHRAKIIDVIIGVSFNFKPGKIVSLSCIEEIAPFGDSFVSSELSVVLEDADGLFAYERDTSLFRFLTQKNTIVSASIKLDIGGGSSESMSLGQYRVSSAPANQQDGTIKIVARSPIDRFKATYNQTVHIAKSTAGAVAKKILQELGWVSYSIPDSMESQPVWDYTDDADGKSLLQELAMACCHYVRCDRSGVLEFAPISVPLPGVTATARITKAKQSSFPVLTLANERQHAKVNFTQYTRASSISEIATSSVSGLVSGTSVTVWIEHDKADITSATVSSGYSVALDWQGITSAKVTVTSLGTTDEDAEVTLIGYLYSEQVVSVTTDDHDDSEDKVFENRFVCDQTHALALATIADAWLARTVKASVSWRGDPSVESGDMALLETKFGQPKMLVTKTQNSWNGALEGSMEGLTDV